jgi:nucleotide-binding universal stress UspA family protein
VGHGAPAVDADTIRTALRTEGDTATEAIIDRATARGLDATGSVVEGRPVDAILDHVDDRDIELVVMGTHGRSGLERYLVGSATERVRRRTDVPVFVVRNEG